MKLCEACVKHILLYCSEVWSLPQLLKGRDITNFESNYEQFVPNRIQAKFSKYVLGAHKSATNIAILGELGFYPLSLNALKSSVGYWLHILNVNDNNLIFHSYKDNLLIKDGLFIKLKRFFLEVIGFGHIWDNQTTFSKLRTLSAVTDILQNRYFDFWHKLLFNDNRVIGGNKLRTYRKIKTDFKREQYLYADVDKKSLSNFIKIRVSNCNLNIEKGHYLKLPVEQRICQLCHTDVRMNFISS
jgi:hypothetical protein